MSVLQGMCCMQWEEEDLGQVGERLPSAPREHLWAHLLLQFPHTLLLLRGDSWADYCGRAGLSVAGVSLFRNVITGISGALSSKAEPWSCIVFGGIWQILGLTGVSRSAQDDKSQFPMAWALVASALAQASSFTGKAASAPVWLRSCTHVP